MTAPPFLPFALPEIGEEEIAEVVDTLRSGWVTTGPKARRFEQDFAAFLGDPTLQAIAVNSATAGLHLALEALGIGPGDEVITTTHTFTATAEVVRYLGADVVLVDIDPATLNIDPARVEVAITPRTRAIIPVHYAGLAANMDAILTLARRHGLKVVEDAAHALPTTCGGALVGTLASDATVFSFYANKTITTGEGGMVVTRDPELAKRVRVMRLHGISRDAFDRFTAKTPSWHYEIVAPGYKYNLTDIAAALGLHQLQRARGFQQRRAAIAQRYRAAFADLPVQLPPEPAAGELHAWHLYVLRLTDAAPLARDAFIERLFELGIGVSVHYIPLHLHPYWRERYGLDAAQFPHSQHAYERMLSLPLYTKMSEADIERVIAAVRQLLLRG
ncbi:UDP-4-amino-4,6-dideoxy-N-acetyl-beta-L-altrosamine transaminase [Methylibium sp. Pch-M]|uniref:DegT/DnrJ/EryC1/StrS family aminotransferase n=1 Tax=Methylibium sp. Pch-M TaxID=2082386 RepID=UPI0010103C16|nr:DegT/DnrJ/EryC1/StrS aminotransferase family protein [Methylibium sp. Pch-M]QAZ40113.1 UDP-4-amino-4,6-dideoxy-N-acetyl-beta-L-altrosamine transaminase [Methylibium sp. Pch-M]